MSHRPCPSRGHRVRHGRGSRLGQAAECQPGNEELTRITWDVECAGSLEAVLVI